jgi:hypothetical protein
MQTIQFVHSLRAIVARLKVKEISDFLHPLTINSANISISEVQKNQFSALLFESRVGFESLQQNPSTARLLEALGLPELYDPAKLGKLVSTYHAAQGTHQIRNVPDTLTAVNGFYSLLHWLQKFETVCFDLLEREKVGETPVDEEILPLRLVDYEGDGVEADRMQQFLAVLIQLHTDLARAFGFPAARLKIRFVDSGSDIVVAIQSLKIIIDMIKGLYSELWVKVRHRNFEDFDRKIDSLSNGLTFVSALQDQVKKEAISTPEAEILKVRVLSEMIRLMGVGGSVAQDDERIEMVDQRKLLVEKRGIRLLGTGVPNPSDSEK